MTNHVTNKHLYDAINSLERKILRRLRTDERKIDKNTDFRNQLTGKIIVLMGVVGVGINILWDSIINRR